MEKHYLIKIGILGGLFMLLTWITLIPSCRNTDPPDKMKRSGNVRVAEKMDVSHILATAQSLPPEFASDIMLTLIERKQIASQAQVRQLIEESFARASNAQTKVRLSYVSGEADTKLGYLSKAYDLKQDALSLQCRAIEAMLNLDKSRAQTMFARINIKLYSQQLDCTDALIYDVSDYYRILERICNETFEPTDTGKERAALFLTKYLGNITSPTQIGPVLNLVSMAGPNLPHPHLRSALQSIIGDLDRIQSNYLPFSLSMYRDSVVEKLGKVAHMCEQRGFVSHQLLNTFREYTVRNLKCKRCVSSTEVARQQQVLPPYIRELNNILNHSAITMAESTPPESSIMAQKPTYWKSPDAANLLRMMKKLRFGAGRKELSLEEKQTAEWQAQLSELLAATISWDIKTEHSVDDYFHQKCHLFYTLLDILPPGETRKSLTTAYAQFLSNQYSNRRPHIEWAMHLKLFLTQSREPSEEDYGIAILSKSDLPAIQVYANLNLL